jgi:hypothetical protein
MAARAPTRSQSGAKAEARRRVAEKMAAAEEVLGDYITAGSDAERLRAEVARAEGRQADALGRLAGLVGRAMAADMAEVDEAKVRSALAKRPARRGEAGSDTTHASDTAADAAETTGEQPPAATQDEPAPDDGAAAPGEHAGAGLTAAGAGT